MALEIYSKRFADLQRIIATYSNGTAKSVWYEKGGKKCCLASGQPSTDNLKFLCKMCARISFEELENLVECLGKCVKGGTAVNYFELSDGTDYNGNPTRLVLKDSPYQGLMVVMMKASNPVVEFASIDVDMDDPNHQPVNTATTTSDPKMAWSECFEKFYISKHDDLHQVQKSLREFCIDLNHRLIVDDESEFPDIPPPLPADFPTSTPKQLQKQTHPKQKKRRSRKTANKRWWWKSSKTIPK